jgi:AcrR family transcriptional regulator
MPTAYASADKRAELVAAATGLLNEQGLHRTMLVRVADRSSVPLGNFYHCVKTKDELAEAVVASHEQALHQRFGLGCGLPVPAREAAAHAQRWT